MIMLNCHSIHNSFQHFQLSTSFKVCMFELKLKFRLHLQYKLNEWINMQTEHLRGFTFSWTNFTPPATLKLAIKENEQHRWNQ